MYLVILAAIFTSLAAAAPAIKDPYPAPCGRSVPSGICTTQDGCYEKGGFYVQRDCPFYNVLDVGCCYDVPDKK